MTEIILLVIAVGFGIARFVVPVKGEIVKADFFKDFAHLYVGFLFGYAAYAENEWQLWAMPIGLTVVEVIAFVTRRKKV